MYYKFIVETDITLFECVCEYVYKNYNNLQFKQTNIVNNTKNFTTDTIRNESNINYKFFIGNYKFMFNNNIHMTFDYSR
jgi:hypothetical protein